MKQRLKFLFSSISFFFIFFLLWKLIFMFYHHKKSFELSLFEWFKVFWYGQIMDLSITFYVIIPVILFILIISIFSKKILKIITKVYIFIITTISGLIYMIDLELYRHWDIRLDASPIKYLSTPSETFGSAEIYGAIFVFIVFLIMITSFLYFYNKKILIIIDKFEKYNWKIFPVFTFLLAFSIIPIRGGIGIAPLNLEFVYFHKTNIFANHAAINPIWNVVKSISRLNKKLEINYLDNNLAKTNFESLYTKTKNTKKIIDIEKPNIIIIILESFYTKFTETSINNQEVTPNFNKLKKEGIYFSQMYATGMRTDFGVPGILCGYPAHPLYSVTGYSTKIEKLSFLIKDLQQTGYKTEWIYGGDNNFANFNSFLINSGFDNIIGQSDFNKSYPTAKWGIHDEYTFDELLNYCNSTQQPFAKVYLSLSNHEPFELPKKGFFNGDDSETKFFNTANYTDSCLNNFIENAKNQSWWNNTLILITADHGTPKISGTDEFDRQHIPFLILGGALNLKDTIYNNIVSQTDISISLLNQLDISKNSYIFSKDIFNSNEKSFAFFAFNNGFGFITDSCKLLFDNNSKTFVKEIGKVTEKDREISKSYFQFFITDFNSK